MWSSRHLPSMAQWRHSASPTLSNTLPSIVAYLLVAESPSELSDICRFARGESDHKSFSVIKLSNGLVLCLREVDTHLGLVTMLREENFDKHGLLEFNFGILKEALAAARQTEGHDLYDVQ